MGHERPNILLITTDQQHYSTLGATNRRIQTPALDELGRQGVRFDRAYCPNPTCTPTRASIVTGMYPSQHGAWSLGTKLFEDVPVLGDRLGEAGYFTSLIGKAHFQPLASAEGMESLECQPTLRDLDFWRGFHGPWYGFEHVEVARNHACESHAGQHYAIWMEENGLTNWSDYFADWPNDPQGRRRRYAQRHWNLPEEFHYTRWTGERTVAQLDRAAGGDRPFFIWASFQDPHPPYVLSEPWASMYDPAEMAPGALLEGEHEKNPRHFRMTQEKNPRFKELYFEDQTIHGFQSHLHDQEALKKNVAIYYGMVSFIDQQVGRILGSLEGHGLAENTLVVFTTDHGHFLGQHGLIAKGAFHYEDMIRVPMIVRWPGRVPAGQASEAIQNLVDLAPTFLSAAGLETPGTMTGINQLSTWRGEQAVRAGTIVENHHTATTVHCRTYVNQRYKITVYRQGSDGELFDFVEDPGEVNNLWHDPSAGELKCRLLEEFMQAVLAQEPMRMPRIIGA